MLFYRETETELDFPFIWYIIVLILYKEGRLEEKVLIKENYYWTKSSPKPKAARGA
jgi:hypothetical protein